MTNSYKNETGNSDYIIIKAQSTEKKKPLQVFLNPTKEKDKVFDLQMKNFQNGIFLKIQANLDVNKNFLKIFNFNWNNGTYNEIFRLMNASKYLPNDGVTYLKIRSFTGLVTFYEKQ